MLRWAGISAVSIAAIVVFMAAGSGRAADREGPGAKPSAMAGSTGAVAMAAGGHGGAAAVTASPSEKPEKPVKAEGGAPVRKKARRGAKDEAPEAPPGQGPPPPSPLTMDGLRQQLHRDRADGSDLDAPPRVKLEQLLSEVTKARESLHADTAKLEAMAGNEAPADPAAAAPSAVAGPAGPPPKNPLDVLAKALRGIKPEQAGPIVARLDKGLAATVLLKMPPVDAGKIMGALKPEVAAELATQIAMRAPPASLGGRK
ncbi:MAG TPA: hypothetical protein VGP07_03000 [Polyangia bacterium]